MTIEFAIENLFPSAEIQPAVSHGRDNLIVHDLALHMGVGIILGAGMIFTNVVTLLARRLVRSNLFQPDLAVVVRAGFIIGEDTSCDVHRADHSDLALPKSGGII